MRARRARPRGRRRRRRGKARACAWLPPWSDTADTPRRPQEVRRLDLGGGHGGRSRRLGIFPLGDDDLSHDREGGDRADRHPDSLRMLVRTDGRERTPDDEVCPSSEGCAVDESDAEAVRSVDQTEELRGAAVAPDERALGEENGLEAVHALAGTAAQLAVPQFVRENAGGCDCAETADGKELDAASARRQERYHCS